jgi:V8-like Glu-specific endopeptidase
VSFRYVNVASALICGALSSLPAERAVAAPIELSPQIEGGVQDVNLTTPVFTTSASRETSFWNLNYTNDQSNVSSLRLHFKSITTPEGFGGKLVLTNASGIIIETIQGSDLAALNDGWSKIVNGRTLTLTVVSAGSPVGFNVTVDKVAYTGSEGFPLSTIGANEMQPIEDYVRSPAISAASRPIAKLSFIRDGKQLTCTGFLYGGKKNQMMTNEHCVNSADICRTTIATFMYQDEDGGTFPGVQFRCRRFVNANATLDFAQIELEGTPADQFGSLQLLDQDVVVNQDLMVIQHPGGKPKMISLLNCRVDFPVADGIGTKSDIAHSCDTAKGSSGSPLLTLAGGVVGLHHFGVAEGPFWKENRAVRMKEILKVMKN